MQESDEELVARVVASRDQRAFGELVQRHQSRIRGWLRQLTRNPAQADDIAQETFMTAWEKLGTYSGSGRFGSWLMKVAYNEFRQSYRSAAGTRRLAEAVAAEAGEPVQDPEPAELAATDLERMLAVLETDERVTMVLCYAYGCSHGEASEISGMPLGTVKSHIRRGKAKIQERFLGGAGVT